MSTFENQEDFNLHVEKLIREVVGQPIVNAVTALASAAGLILKTAGVDPTKAATLAQALVDAIPEGSRTATLIHDKIATDKT